MLFNLTETKNNSYAFMFKQIIISCILNIFIILLQVSQLKLTEKPCFLHQPFFGQYLHCLQEGKQKLYVNNIRGHITIMQYNNSVRQTQSIIKHEHLFMHVTYK